MNKTSNKLITNSYYPTLRYITSRNVPQVTLRFPIQLTGIVKVSDVTFETLRLLGAQGLALRFISLKQSFMLAVLTDRSTILLS
jgi:hypothetical protein